MNLQASSLFLSTFIFTLVATASTDSPPEKCQAVPAADRTERIANSNVVTDAEKYEVAESIFRGDITSWASRTPVRAFFLEIDKEDPPAEFLLRFSDIHTVSVKGNISLRV